MLCLHSSVLSVSCYSPASSGCFLRFWLLSPPPWQPLNSLTVGGLTPSFRNPMVTDYLLWLYQPLVSIAYFPPCTGFYKIIRCICFLAFIAAELWIWLLPALLGWRITHCLEYITEGRQDKHSLFMYNNQEISVFQRSIHTYLLTYICQSVELKILLQDETLIFDH